MIKQKFFILIVCCLFFNGMKAQVITVSTSAYTHEELITEVLINSPCAIVENITAITGTNFGFPNGIGYFENTNPNFPIENGLILATGNVLQAPGPVNSNTWGTGGWPGDAQLFNYIQSLGIDPGLTSYNDATIMEFDFTPLTDSISFHFVFGSNEYGTFQCDFSDAFAFFLENYDTGEIVNMALVPGTPTETPISVTTIRDNAHNPSCSSQNPEYFDRFYGTTGFPPGTAPVNLQGHTVLMQAWQYVDPGVTYKMKLVIADRNDSSWDSAVFIQGGSFFIGEADLGEDMTIENGNAVCDTEEVILSITAPEDAIITWFFNGIEIPGENEDTLVVTEPGVYGVHVVNPLAPDCPMEDEIIIEFKTTPIVNLGEDISLCGEVSVELNATPENIDDLPDASYVWYLDGVEIPDATEAILLATEIGTYSVEVSTSLECTGTDSINVVLISYSVNLGEDMRFCDGDSYEIIPSVSGIIPEDATYVWSTGETSFSITVSTTGTYSVEVHYLDCVETDSVYVEFTELPVVDLGEDIKKCAQDTVTLRANISNEISPDATYSWFFNGGELDSNTTSIEVTEPGTYTVVVNDNGCIGSDEVEVYLYANQNCTITQGISPNNDGYNDFFDLEFLSDKSGPLHLMVYNRFGTEIFNMINYVNEWGGQDKDGNILPVGTYFYVVGLQNGDPINGYIYLNK